MLVAPKLHRRAIDITRRIVPWCLLLFAPGAFANDDHSQHPVDSAPGALLLSLPQAIALGAKNGPEAAKSKAVHRAARELGAVASPLVNQLPYVQAQVGPRVSRGELSPEVIFSVSQPFTLGDVAGVQKRIARATLEAVDATTRSAQLMDAQRAGHAWIALALADRVLKLRQEFTQQASALVGLARARVAAGEAQPVELALAEGEFADAQALVIDAEGTHYAAELDLSYAVGEVGGRVDVSGGLALPSPAHTRQGVHPDIVAAESRAALAGEQVQYAKVQQAPTLALGVQYQREGTGDQILTAVATIPLPVAQPWAFQQTQQRMAADAARAEANYVRSTNAKELRNARHELDHTQSLYEHLERAGLPPAREAQRLALLRYSLGENDFADVSLARQRLLRTEERVAQALAGAQQANVHWRAVTGTLLATEDL